jgi:V-type H+-transporting ATPase subunit d
MSCAPRRYGYMIDNVILLITGGLNNLPIADLIPRCHPMGSFDGMAAVNIATTLEELYSAIIIDTPIGRSTTALN